MFDITELATDRDATPAFRSSARAAEAIDACARQRSSYRAAFLLPFRSCRGSACPGARCAGRLQVFGPQAYQFRGVRIRHGHAVVVLGTAARLAAGALGAAVVAAFNG